MLLYNQWKSQKPIQDYQTTESKKKSTNKTADNFKVPYMLTDNILLTDPPHAHVHRLNTHTDSSSRIGPRCHHIVELWMMSYSTFCENRHTHKQMKVSLETAAAVRGWMQQAEQLPHDTTRENLHTPVRLIIQ